MTINFLPPIIQKPNDLTQCFTPNNTLLHTDLCLNTAPPLLYSYNIARAYARANIIFWTFKIVYLHLLFWYSLVIWVYWCHHVHEINMTENRNITGSTWLYQI